MKSGNKSLWIFKIVIITVGIIGVAFIGLGVFSSGLEETIFISIGSSLVASGISTVYFKLYDWLKDEETEERFEKIINLIENSTPDNRVHFGRHLTNVFQEMLQGYDKNSIIPIDVIGLELNRFLRDQFENLKKYPNIKMRMIIQNPCSGNFDSMIYHEGRNTHIVFENIMDLTRTIKEYNQEKEEDKKIKLYWLDYPSSITVTRVGKTMYVRPRFLKEGEGGDNMFFEKYSSEDKRTFSAYTDFFEKAIGYSVEPLSDDALLSRAEKKLKELNERR